MTFDTLKGNHSFLQNKRNELNFAFEAVFSDAISAYSPEDDADITTDEIIEIYESIVGPDNVSPDLPFAAFCLEFTKRFADRINVTIGNDYDSEEYLYPQIAYLKNAFTDKAYRKFSRKFDKVSAGYFSGFREVCEEVFYGRCAYAILPIYSSSDGPLMSFKKLLGKYDLKVVLATEIEMSDESLMRYALLQKGATPINNIESADYLDVSIVVDDGFRFGAFLAACESLGATIKSMSSRPMEYSENSELFSVAFGVNNANISALCLFFECAHIRYTIEGLYSII